MPTDEVGDYEACPFCEIIFPARTGLIPGLIGGSDSGSQLEQHIRGDHHKVKVRKGSNYKWLDLAEVKKRLDPGQAHTATPARRK